MRFDLDCSIRGFQYHHRREVVYTENAKILRCLKIVSRLGDLADQRAADLPSLSRELIC